MPTIQRSLKQKEKATNYFVQIVTASKPTRTGNGKGFFPAGTPYVQVFKVRELWSPLTRFVSWDIYSVARKEEGGFLPTDER